MKINIKMFAFLQAIFSCQTSKLAFGWWSAVLGFRSHQLTHMALRMSIAQEYSVGLNRKHIGNPWKVVVGATRLWDLGICTFQGAQRSTGSIFLFLLVLIQFWEKKALFFSSKTKKHCHSMGFSTSNWRVYCGRTDQASIAWTCLPKPFWLDKNVNNHQKLERRREKYFLKKWK